jgi:serine/threonine protein kinase
MNDPSFDRDVEILAETLRLPATERMEYLDRACGKDDALCRKVQALLDAHEQAGDFLGEPASGFALTGVGYEKPDDVIGRYKLLRQIGEGGCGVVFMAEQGEPVRRRVALKVVKPGMDTKSVIARFEAERQALALMDHPSIAHVFDAGTTQHGRPFFVMELLTGIKITDYCDRNSLTASDRLRLFIQVCDAVQHAHQKGIIHRDIKPSNILVVTDADGKAWPKIIDFGIAKAITGQQLTDKTLFTVGEMLIGTPAYMSPEQADLASVDVDTRTDVYSLGVLLYELLTGSRPFDTGQLMKSGLDEIRRVIREQEPIRPSTRLSRMTLADLTDAAQHRQSDPARLIRAIRGDLDWIVMKALEKDRARRYATANGLAMDVQRFLSGETVVARPPSRLYKFRKLVLRNKLAFAGVTLFTLFLIAGLIVVSAALATERRALRQAESEAAKSKQVTAILVESVQDIDPGVAAGQDKTMLHGILDGVARRLDTGLTNQLEVQAQLRATIGKVYRLIGLYERAETMDRAALAIYRKSSPSDSPQTASTLDELGLALINRDALPEAERAETESLAIRRRLFGDASPEVATSLDVLAHVYMDERKIVEAESPVRQSLAIRRKLLDPESLEVADSLRNLTVILGDQGKWAEAEDTARKVLAIRRKCLGPENPGVASALQDLAWAVGARGKLAEAQALEREALELRAKFLPERHPEIAESLYLLGDRLRERGDLEDAYAVLDSALSMQQQNGDRAALFETLRSLGLTLEDQGKLSEAEAVFRRRFDLWREVSERERPRTSSEAQDLSRVLRHEGKPAEAEKVQTESLAIRRRLFGDASTEVAASLNDLANDYLDDRKYAEAESLSRQSLAIRRKLLGPESLEVADSIRNLTIILIAEHKFHDAEEFRNQALAPENARETSSVDLLDLRISLLARQRQFREAVEDATIVLKLQPAVNYRYHTLAPLLAITGNRPAYEQLCREMLAKFGTTSDPNVADRTAKDCLLLPHWGVDLTMVNKLADTAIKAKTNDPSMPFFEACKAMSEYRMEHFAEAVVWAEKLLNTTHDDLRAYVDAILAMAHWQLGEKEQAREMLARGNRLTPPMSPVEGVNDLGDAWGNWLFARISLDEAATLIQPGSTAVDGPK